MFIERDRSKVVLKLPNWEHILDGAETWFGSMRSASVNPHLISLLLAIPIGGVEHLAFGGKDGTANRTLSLIKVP